MTTTNESNLSNMSWKRAWSIEEIIQSSQCWSLAGDSGVCQLIAGFSADLLNELRQLSNSVNTLSVESKQTNVIIQNAFNDFCMLANNQFMENLVEDVATIAAGAVSNGSENIGSDPNANVNSFAHIIPYVSQSLQMGIQVLENQFEILDVPKPAPVESNADESDTDERSTTQLDYLANEPIYHPKDPYENRHLPHLIGTQAFVDDDTLGIGEIDDQEEVQYSSAGSEHSQSERQSQSLSTSNLSDSESEIDEQIVTSSESVNNLLENNQNSNDLFVENPAPVKKAGQHTITDQFQKDLLQRLSIKTKYDPNSDSDIAPENEVENVVPSESIGNKSHSQTVIPKETKVLPLKSTGITKSLFGADDSADEDDIFGDISSNINKGNTYSFGNSVIKPSSADTRTLPGKSAGISVHSDSDGELFSPVSRETDNKTKITSSNNTNQTKELNGKSIKNANNVPIPDLEELSDTSSDLFAVTPLGDKGKIRTPAQQNVDSNKSANEKVIRDVTNQHLFQTKTNSESEENPSLLNVKAGPSTAISQKPLPKARATGRLFSDTDSDSDGLFDSPKKVPIKTNNKIDTPSLLPKSESTIPKKSDRKSKVKKPIAVGSIFDLSDSSSDDIFDFLNTSKKSKPNNQTSSSTKTDSLPATDNLMSGNQKLPEKSRNAPNKEPEIITNANNSNDVPEKPMEDYVSQEINNSANNADEYDKPLDESFDEIILGNHSISKKDKAAATKPAAKSNEITNDNRQSSLFDPLALPPMRSPLDNILDANSDPLNGNSSPQSSLRIVQVNNAGSVTLESLSPPNLKTSPLEQEPSMNGAPRASLHKLPAGATQMGGLTSSSFLNELRKSRISFNSDSDSIVEDNKNKLTPVTEIQGADEMTKNEIDSEVPMKIDFKKKLQSALNLNIKPLEAPFKQSPTKSSSPDNDEIGFEKPAEEVRQLNLLTKTRARNNPRRRPTTKKIEVTDVIPNSADIPIDKQEDTKFIPQLTNETNPDPLIAQSDDSFNIFADLPPRPVKKSKTNKKTTSTSNNKTKTPPEVNVDEINDIFAIPSSKPTKKTKKSKPLSDPLSQS